MKIIESNIITMTSKEIAQLTNKTLSHVNRDIKIMLNDLKYDDPNLDSKYKTVTYQQYTKYGIKNHQMYLLDKELCLCLISGYSSILRLRIIKRWGELEANHKVITLPDFNNPALAARAWAEQYEAAQIANTRLNRLIHDDKSYTSTELAKELGFSSACLFNKELECRKIQYKINNTWILYAKHSTSRYTDIKQTELDNGKIVYNRRWTNAGRDFLLNIFKKEIS